MSLLEFTRELAVMGERILDVAGDDAVSRLNHELARIHVREAHTWPRLASVVDLAIGFAHGAELEHGWWQRERRVVRPYAAINEYIRSQPASSWEIRTAHRNDAWLVRLAPYCSGVLDRDALAVEARHGYVPHWFTCPVVRVSTLRGRLAARTDSHAIRRRLDDETGYAKLRTLEECLDASRASATGTVGARFCVALAVFCPEERHVA